MEEFQIVFGASIQKAQRGPPVLWGAGCTRWLLLKSRMWKEGRGPWQQEADRCPPRPGSRTTRQWSTYLSTCSGATFNTLGSTIMKKNIKKEFICVCNPNLSAIQQKLAQHVKSTTLKKKIKNNLLFFSILSGSLEQKEDMEENTRSRISVVDFCWWQLISVGSLAVMKGPCECKILTTVRIWGFSVLSLQPYV